MLDIVNSENRRNYFRGNKYKKLFKVSLATRVDATTDNQIVVASRIWGEFILYVRVCVYLNSNVCENSFQIAKKTFLLKPENTIKLL